MFKQYFIIKEIYFMSEHYFEQYSTNKSENPLETFRFEINSIDTEILKLLDKRMKISKKIGDYKKSNNIQVLDKSREKIVIDNLVSKNSNMNLNLNEELIKNLWNNIMSYSKNIQN